MNEQRCTVGARRIAMMICAGLCAVFASALMAGPASATIDVTTDPTEWDFGNRDVEGLHGAPLWVYVENNGDEDVTFDPGELETFQFIGDNPDDFYHAGRDGGFECDDVLSPSESCRVNVFFVPLDYGARTAQMEIDFVETGPIFVDLSGTGV